MKELKLGPLPKMESVRASVTLSRTLKDALDLYTTDYTEVHGPAETADLIPHMLESFLRSDKAFMKRHAASVKARSAEVRTPLPSAAPVSLRAVDAKAAQ